VAAGARLAKPILIVHVEAGPEPRFNAVHHAVRAMAGSRATIIEAYVALAGAVTGQVSTGASVTVDDGAALAHVKVACRAATHLATSVVGIGEGATYRAFQFTAGSELVRNQMFVTFSGAAARLDISGAMLGRGREHIDTTLVIDHATHGCESRELFKSVLDDRARAVFQGKVIVRRQAQKTDGKQMAQALMLSEDAEFDSKPELEIYADDVACGHGSTSAEIDPALMFYLRSRGIPKPQARAMLIESFIGEAIDKVEDEAVREALAAMARVWLAGH
jgi:Fe-S cluster assembly protein SufD